MTENFESTKRPLGKPGDGFRDLLRIAINTTLGIGGLFDPATELGLIDHNEDFGQTLAKWGVPTGPYLVIPFLGPSTLRNAFAGMVDIRLDPLIYYYPVAHRNTIIGMRIIHQRSELLAMESVVFGDRYLFFRDAYLQRREFLEQDGEVEDLFDADF